MDKELDWQFDIDEDDNQDRLMLIKEVRVGPKSPAGLMFTPINPEVLRLWIKSRPSIKENYIWHFIFGGIIFFGLLAMYIF